MSQRYSELRKRLSDVIGRFAGRARPDDLRESHSPEVAEIPDYAGLKRMASEIDPLYGALYEMANDNEQAAPFAAKRTVAAFGHQWANIPNGKFMLSDPLFKQDVDRIITEEEILINRAWFPEKRVLDAGCGGGRWSYGLAKLGAHVTAVDTNPSAIRATRMALAELNVKSQLLQSDLESLHSKLPQESFDLVWSWGVLHRCVSFTQALKSIAMLVKQGGLIYIYVSLWSGNHWLASRHSHFQRSPRIQLFAHG
jgi:precorrin-6B methylase 2